MIIDARNILPGDRLAGDVAIVGAGAAGIALASRLARAGHDVVLLEGGGEAYDWQSQTLYDGEATGDCLSPEDKYLASSRLRYLGGSTNHWGGWCRPLDDIDFERRDWLPMSGWPITGRQLGRYYEETCRVLETAPFDPALESGPGEPALAHPIDPEQPVVTTRYFHFSPPVRFRLRHQEELASSARIRLLLRANVLRLEQTADGGRIESLTVAAEPRRNFAVRARLFVLAAGAIENARLLLLSPSPRGGSLGNEHDLVGRYFMEHPHRRIGSLLFGHDPADLDPFRFDPPRRIAALTLDEDYRRRHRLLGVTFLLVRPTGSAPELGDIFGATRGLDRLRGLDPSGEGTVFDVNIMAEPTPNRESRVTLADRLERFGLPRVQLDWRLAEGDLDSIVRSAEVLGSELARAGSGRLRLEVDRERPWAGTVGGAHHMGTTRMAERAEDGVVNKRCRVFAVPNLYVAGSSVFPTAGYANPTFTLIALTLRLADRLDEELRRA